MTSNRSSAALADTIYEFEQVPSFRALQERIDRLTISADAKALLMDLAKVTLEVGGKVLAFGRKLLAFIIELANRFQNVLIGILIALALSAVLATLPLLGPAISAVLTPLMVALGVARGAVEDFRNMSVQREIEALKQRMSILAAYS